MKHALNFLLTVVLIILLCGLRGVGPVHAEQRALYVHGVDGDDTGSDCLDSASPCQTITYAISEAMDGDTLVIAAGTYSENLEIAEKTLTLRGGYTVFEGQWLPDTGETVIDGHGAGRTVFVHANNSVLEKLTIVGGKTPDGGCWGGGVWVTDGDVTIRSSIIADNWADCSGGGIEVNNDWGPAHLTVVDSVVKGNHAVWSKRGNDRMGRHARSREYPCGGQRGGGSQRSGHI